MIEGQPPIKHNLKIWLIHNVWLGLLLIWFITGNHFQVCQLTDPNPVWLGVLLVKHHCYMNPRTQRTLLCLGFRSCAALGVPMARHEVGGEATWMFGCFCSPPARWVLSSSSSFSSSSASSSSFSSTMSASTSASTVVLPTLGQALRQLRSSVRTAGPQPGTFPAQCAPLDLNLGPS